MLSVTNSRRSRFGCRGTKIESPPSKKSTQAVNTSKHAVGCLNLRLPKSWVVAQIGSTETQAIWIILCLALLHAIASPLSGEHVEVLEELDQLEAGHDADGIPKQPVAHAAQRGDRKDALFLPRQPAGQGLAGEVGVPGAVVQPHRPVKLDGHR